MNAGLSSLSTTMVDVLDASIVSYLLDEIQDLPGGLVYGLVAFLVFGEAALFIGFILPGETAVIVAGVVASKGPRQRRRRSCVLVVLRRSLGDSVGYEVGRHYGAPLIALPILRRAPAPPSIARSKACDVAGRSTSSSVASPRSCAPIMPGLAGMSRLHYRRFLVANAAGALLWGVAYTLLGYFAGTALDSIERYSGWAGRASSSSSSPSSSHSTTPESDARRETAAWQHDRPDDAIQRRASSSSSGAFIRQASPC